MPIDRSISALRTLRPDRDAGIFWFRDDLHQPYPISPMGMTTIQKHHAWGYHVASEQTQLPPSKGAHVKIYQGRVYLGFALIDDPEEVGRRAKAFGQLVEHCTDHWDGVLRRLHLRGERQPGLAGRGRRRPPDHARICSTTSRRPRRSTDGTGRSTSS